MSSLWNSGRVDLLLPPFVTYTPIPNIPLPDNWASMSIEEKIDLRNQLMSDLARAEIDNSDNLQYIHDYLELVEEEYKKDAKKKYDIAFKRFNRYLRATDIYHYLLFDLDEHDFVLVYEKRYGRHYGTFKGSWDSDWKVDETKEPFIDPYRYRYIQSTGELVIITTDNSISDLYHYDKCDMDEAINAMLHSGL